MKRITLFISLALFPLFLNAQIYAIPPSILSPSNFANTNLTLTGNRTHDADSSSLTVNSISTLTLNTVDSRKITVDNSKIEINSDLIELRGTNLKGWSQPALRFYEDPDNAVASQYFELKAANSMSSNVSLKLPAIAPASQGMVMARGVGSEELEWILPNNISNTNLNLTGDRTLSGTSNYSLTLGSMLAVNINNGSSSSGQIRIYEDSDNGSHYRAITVPSALTQNLTLTLPDGNPSTGQAITFSNTGVGSWTTVPTYGSISGTNPVLYFNGTSLVSGNINYSTSAGGRFYVKSIGASGVANPVRYPLTVGTEPNHGAPTAGQTTGIKFQCRDNLVLDTVNVGILAYEVTDPNIGTMDAKVIIRGALNNALSTVFEGNPTAGTISFGGLKMPLIVDKTITTGGTTGDQTINKYAGSVNFAAAATSLTVTNSLVTTSSVIVCTIGTNDATMTSVQAVAGTGSFVIHANAAATAETRVNFIVIN